VQYGVCIPDRAATPEVTIVPANEAAWGISRPSWASAAKRSDASASGSRPGAAVGHKEGLRSRRRTRQEAARADRLRAFRGARDERPVAYLDGEAAGGCAVEPRTRLCAPAGWLCASTSSPGNQELQDVRAWNAGSLKAAREPLQPRLAVWMSIAATVAACSLAACGGGESEPGAARSTTSTAETGALPPPEQRCRGGKTRPLELETVIEVGRRHGITLHSDPACQPDPTVVSQAANVVLYGPDKNAERDREITQEEGAVTCLLRENAGPTAANSVERVRYAGDEETHFKLLNVACVIYPEPENADEQLRRLQAAMDELQEQAARNA
jgi:hypothetical protein